ncbi:hypothetical protein BGZ80_005629, partial [Entomortierella chlamydospora]
PELDIFSREATDKTPPQVRRESSLLATGFGVTPPQLERKLPLLDTYGLPPKVGVAPPQARCRSTSFDSDKLPPQVRYDLLFQSLVSELPPRDDLLLHAKDDLSQQAKRELPPKVGQRLPHFKNLVSFLLNDDWPDSSSDSSNDGSSVGNSDSSDDEGDSEDRKPEDSKEFDPTNWTPQRKMQFTSEKAARECLQEWAWKKGFDVHLGRTKRNEGINQRGTIVNIYL